MSEAALALVEQPGDEKPKALIQRATDVAAVCKLAVLSSVQDIRGKRYVKVEGWCTIAAAYGCIPSIREVVEEERGIRAIAELKRSDGTVVATAEGFCGLDEPEWSNRALYARRGMAQTRAISRVCRTAFAFVLKLIDADLQTTPADEIPLSETSAAATVDARPSGSGRSAPVRSNATRVRFGKSKGKYLDEIDDQDLEYHLRAARKTVEAKDPKWGEANEAWLAAVEAEVARRGSA